MYAVTIEPLNSVVFLAEHPGEGPWEIQEDVGIDVPANYALRPEGAAPPDSVLAVSTADPRLYKVFRYRREAAPAGYQPTGKNFGGVFSRPAWEHFVTSLLEALANQAGDEDEPPGATDAALRALKGGR